MSVLSNAFWAAAGNIAGAGCQWGLVVLLARFQPAEVVGQYSLALAIASPVFLLASMHLRTLQATDSRQSFQFADYFSFRAVSTALALLICLALPGALRLSGAAALMLSAVSLSKASESLSEIVYGRMQQRERMDTVAGSMILRGVLSVLAMAGAVVRGPGGVAGTWAVTGVSLAVLAGYDLRKVPWGGFGVSRVARSCRALAEQAGPLSVLMMMVSLNLNIPRYWLARYRSEQDVGIFSAIAFVAIAGNTLIMAAGQAAGPRMAGYFAGRDLRRFLRGAAGLTGVGLALGAAGIAAALVCGGWVLGVLYGPGYAGHAPLMSKLMVAGGLGYLASCGGYILASARRFRIQIPILGLATGTTAAAGWFLVPSHGLDGAAAAQCLGNAVQAASSALVVWLLVRGHGEDG